MLDWDHGKTNSVSKHKTCSAEIVACEDNFCFHYLSFFYYVWGWEDNLILMVSSGFGILTAKMLVAALPYEHLTCAGIQVLVLLSCFLNRSFRQGF